MEMDSRPYRAFVALFASALLLLTALVVSGIVPLSAPGNRFGSGPVSSEATNNFAQLVVVLMENKNLNEVYGPAPYVTQLADQYSFSQGWSNSTNPSQPDFTPNDGHNMHDNSVASGDAWIQSWVPGLLTAMAGKKAALILMFDEAYTSPPYIYMAFSGPATKLAYKSTASYSHYSLAKLLEDVWGGGSLGQGDVNAPSPLEFFGAGGPPVPDFSIVANPASISFVPSQSATSTISLQSTGGFTGTVALTTDSSPSGGTGSCPPWTRRRTQTSTCTLTGTTAGSDSVTVTGTSGSLAHTTTISASVTTNPPPGGGPPGGRDPLLWPFSRDSVWNLPIGVSAVYVAANIQQATSRGMTTDPDVIILTPNATMTAVYYNSAGWSGGSRCATQGNVLFNAPIPSNFVVQGAEPNDPDGTTANA